MAESKTPEIGDYVLATKYADADPGDHWFVGFYRGSDAGGRHYVVDNDGKQGRGNGFRHVQKIEAEDGAWLLENARQWEIKRPVKSVIDYLNIYRLERELAAANERADKAEQERDSARQAACPPSHVCVPKIPEDETLVSMQEAILICNLNRAAVDDCSHAKAAYKAMLAAHGGGGE
jgi:hypothetical protein